jgi:hypothetical protein
VATGIPINKATVDMRPRISLKKNLHQSTNKLLGFQFQRRNMPGSTAAAVFMYCTVYTRSCVTTGASVIYSRFESVSGYYKASKKFKSKHAVTIP